MLQPKILPMKRPASEPVLDLAPSLQVPIDSIIGQQIACFGLPGSGKTNAAALLCEQFAAHHIPLVVFDIEGDYASLVDVLPRGVLATASNCPTGHDVLNHGLQVVYDLASWGDSEERADLIISIVAQLTRWASFRPSHARVPCLIFLDEAAYWLPEKKVTYLKAATLSALRETFQQLATRGRKQGLTPALFTQRISELAKAVLTPGVYILMRQSLDTDLNRYMEYVSTGDLTAKQIKARIAAFPAGRAIVKLPDGRQKLVNFHERKSEHTSHTPGAAAASRYASLPLPAVRTYGAYLPDEEMEPATPEMPTESAIDEKILYHIGRLAEQQPRGLTCNTIVRSYMKKVDYAVIEQRLLALVEQGILESERTSHSTRYRLR